MTCFALYWSLFKCWVWRLEPRVMQGCENKRILEVCFQHPQTHMIIRMREMCFRYPWTLEMWLQHPYVHILQSCKDTENTFPDAWTTHSLHSSSEAIAARTKQQHMWQDTKEEYWNVSITKLKDASHLFKPPLFAWHVSLPIGARSDAEFADSSQEWCKVRCAPPVNTSTKL